MSEKLKKIFFISFADGSETIVSAGTRIKHQATESEIFFKVQVLNKLDLINMSKINDSIAKLMQPANHGFGFFIWKPILIKTFLEDVLEDDDLLVYTDSGTELVNNKIATKRFLRTLDYLKTQPVLAFRTNYPERNWTKRICLELLRNESDRETPQIEATSIFVRRNELSLAFVKNWENLSTKENGKYINQETSGESIHFIEHREDQSIFSVLYKNEGFKPLRLAMPAFYDNPKRISFLQRWAYGTFLIWPIRNRTGNSLVGKKQKSLLLSALGYPLIYVVWPMYKTRRFIKGFNWYVRSRIWRKT